jgi:hypothetical protein
LGGFFRSMLDFVTWPLRAIIEAPGKLFAGSRRLARISLSARVALATFLFLLICVPLTLFIFIHFDKGRTGFWAYWKEIAIVAALVVLIPLVLYKVLQLWLEGEVHEFDDIERAWNAGLAEMQRRGLDLRETPLFLVLGSAGTAQEKLLFDASKLDFSFRDFPQGQAALHWYASPDAVFVALSGVGSLSRLTQLAGEAEMIEKAQPLPAPLPAAVPGFPRGGFAGRTPDATIQFDQATPMPVPESLNLSPEPASLTPRLAGEGTWNINEQMRDALIAASSRQGQRKAVVMDESQAATEQRRVEFLCRLIRRARQPLCPINGVLTLLSVWLIQRSETEAKSIQWALKRDLNALVDHLRVRCPVTALVVGLEEESGFRELVRRVGREVALGNRIGKGFELWNRPGADALRAVARHACGFIEDCIYSLFREHDSLNKPGNAKLYMLLCKLRRNVLPRLELILAEGYGFERATGTRHESLFFGGCYFAGLGESDERQAFAKRVLDKLPEQQGYLAWTPTAQAEDDRYRLFSQLVLVVDTLVLLGIAAIVAYRFWGMK